MIQEKLVSIFREVFFDNDLTLSRETVAGDVVGWDSLNHVRLIVRIEEEYGIEFDIDEVASLKNVGDLADLIASKNAH